MVIFQVTENPAVTIHDEQLLALLLKLTKIAIVHILLVFETSQQLSVPPCQRRSLARGFFGLDTLLHLTASMILVSVDYEPIKLKLLLVVRIGMARCDFGLRCGLMLSRTLEKRIHDASNVRSSKLVQHLKAERLTVIHMGSGSGQGCTMRVSKRETLAHA